MGGVYFQGVQMEYKLKRLKIFKEDEDDKYIVFRNIGYRNKFTIRTFEDGKPCDKVYIYPKAEAIAMCELCGEDY